jgi:DNA-binding NtrC family response regulator
MCAIGENSIMAVESAMTEMLEGAAMRFLVVDDDVAFNEEVSLVIEALGHTVEGRAFDGESAVKVFSLNPGAFDVVVMDVIMPLENGILAAEKMIKINPMIKILLMSRDWTNQSLAPESKNMRFLRKPFGADEVRQELETLSVTGSCS